MTEKNIPAYEQNYTAEERELAQHLIALEESALEKFFKGDMSGYRSLWSEKSFTYFDAVVTRRTESLAEMKAFFVNIEGKLYSDDYQILSPRVQFGQDMAVLTYQIYAKTNINNIQYNTVEVFQKEESGWRVIHSTWSIIRPMDMDFSAFKTVVV